MKKKNVKKFWNEHKKAIKTAVILVTVPAVIIGICVLVDKLGNRRIEKIFEELEDNIKDEA